MGRRVVSLSRDNVAALPLPCRHCTLWEIGGGQGSGPATKDEWVSAVLLDWGSCGQVWYVDEQVAAFAIYAPPEYLEGAHTLVSATVSPDAVLLTTARVLPAFQGQGLGRALIQSVAKDVSRRRRIRGIEAFGDAQGRENGCVLPVGFLTSVGFTTLQSHPRYPRLRLDLRNLLSWRDDVELAVERWLGALRPGSARPETGAGPAGLSPREEPSGPGPAGLRRAGTTQM